MLNSGKKFTLRATKNINILTLVLSEEKKTYPPPPPLQVKWSVPNGHTGSSSSGDINLDVLMEWYFHQVVQDSVKHY